MKKNIPSVILSKITLFLLFHAGFTAFSQNDPYIQTGSGLGQYGYLEKSAVTTISLNSNAQSNIYQLFARTWLNGQIKLTYGTAVNTCLGPTNVVQNTSDYNFGADALPGLIAYTSVHADYCVGGNSYGGNPNQKGYNERQHVIFGLTDRPSDLSPVILASSGQKNVVLSLKVDFGTDASRVIKRFWIQNTGTLAEGTEISNDGFKLYYEPATGSEVFNGNEASATIYGDYNSNPVTNNLFGHDDLSIPVPSGGLRIYVVLDGFQAGVAAGKTAQVSVINDGISFSPKMDTDFDLARVNSTPASPVSLVTCAPTSTSASRYISQVQFVGTLNPDTSNTSGYTTNGYADYMGLAAQASQIPGGGINMNVSTMGGLGTIKAWVDWNKNGIFEEPSEKIYGTDQLTFQATNVIIGYKVPVGTAPGTYTIRVRASDASGFGPCDVLSAGETEDYNFNVISDCGAVINSVSAAKQCGAGPVLLSASGSAGTTSYRWYSSEFGVAIPGETGSTYITPSLAVGTHTYYVTALNGTCESRSRTPIRVVVSPTPTIQFTQSAPEICGEVASIGITSSGDQEEVTLLEEKFDNTASNPVAFENITLGNTDAESIWMIKTSPFIPDNTVHIVNPAISSGYNNGNFGYIITDKRRSTDLRNDFTLKNSLNASGFTGLKMDFDLYYFSEEDVAAKNYLKIMYSVDGGTNWSDLVTYLTDQGVPSRFDKKTLALPAACDNQPNLKIKFSLFALGASNEWIGDIAAIDNLRIYGNRALPTNFTWTGDSSVLFDSSCSGTPPPGGSPSICIRPTDNDLEYKSQFTVTATAVLSNGCSAQGTITIPNNTKVWNPASAGTDWAAAAWKPLAGVPDISKCVIVKTPVRILDGAHFEARTVKVLSGGSLTVNKDATLKVQNFFNNGAAADAVSVESDGGLVQVNDGAVNVGTITAKRAVTLSSARQQYNYMVSPLEGQSLKTVYPGIDYVLYYNESNNYFYSSSGAYIKGRGLAVKEPNKTGVAASASSATATFQGNITNGAFGFPLVNSAPAASAPANTVRGFNLVGNPYPSNIDLNALYTVNGGTGGNLSSTFYLWDSTVNDIYVQQGSNYGGQSYGIFNAVTPPGTGTGIAATGDVTAAQPKKPTGTVKMGQAFMVRALAASTTLQFNNSIRTTATDAPAYFGKKNGNNAAADRYWMKLVSPKGIAATCAVVYFAGGQDGYAIDDSFTMGGSDAIYSVADHQQLAINGRSSFRNTDVVEVGTNQFASGNYRIGLEEREGIFAAGQSIYLKDRKTGILTDLSKGDYLFEANPGQTVNRFEIVYLPESVLGTDVSAQEALEVYRDGSDFIIRSLRQKITKLEVYDVSGRLVYEARPNAVRTVLPSERLGNGMYILKIYQQDTVTVKKIIH